MKHLSISCLLAATCLVSTTPGMAFPNHSYPRIGGMQWGGAPPEYYARYDLIITSISSSEFWQQAKGINPNLAVLYTRDIQSGSGVDNLPNDWRIYKADGSAFSIYGGSCPLANVTDLCPLVGDQRYNDAVAPFMSSVVDLSVFDGLSTDGLWGGLGGWLPERDEIDLDGSGTGDVAEYGEDWLNNHWRSGAGKIITEIDAALPDDKIFVVNGGTHDGYRDHFNGVNFEYGSSYGTNWYWGNGRYRDLIETLKEPHGIDIDGATTWGLKPETTSTRNEVDFVRYALVTTMLGDGYFSYQPIYKDHYFWSFYDEFELDVGFPTGEPQTIHCADDTECVYVRFFDDGAVILNVSGVPATVTDEELAELPGYTGPYYRFRGGQDPSWNDGESFEAVDLDGALISGGPKYLGDALILVTTPQTVITDVIVDNVAMNTSPVSSPAVLAPDGGWDESCGDRAWGSGCYQWIDGYLQATTSAGSGEASAQFTPVIGVAGPYEIFEWHGSVEGAASNTPYTIVHAGGETTGTIDQSQNDQQWNSLGTFELGEGEQGHVLITNDADGVVVADAFKWVYRGCDPGEARPCVTEDGCPGSETCSPASIWGVCEPEPASEEICDDGLDNDCNGEIDDCDDPGDGPDVTGPTTPELDGDDGCSCRLHPTTASPLPVLLGAMLMALACVRSRSRKGRR